MTAVPVMKVAHDGSCPNSASFSFNGRMAHF
jgi:hypothetical protein